jgi:hypothetical protein
MKTKPFPKKMTQRDKEYLAAAFLIRELVELRQELNSETNRIMTLNASQEG